MNSPTDTVVIPVGIKPNRNFGATMPTLRQTPTRRANLAALPFANTLIFQQVTSRSIQSNALILRVLYRRPYSNY